MGGREREREEVSKFGGKESELGKRWDVEFFHIYKYHRFVKIPSL